MQTLSFHPPSRLKVAGFVVFSSMALLSCACYYCPLGVGVGCGWSLEARTKGKGHEAGGNRARAKPVEGFRLERNG